MLSLYVCTFIIINVCFHLIAFTKRDVKQDFKIKNVVPILITSFFIASILFSKIFIEWINFIYLAYIMK